MGFLQNAFSDCNVGCQAFVGFHAESNIARLQRFLPLSAGLRDSGMRFSAQRFMIRSVFVFLIKMRALTTYGLG